MEEKNIFQSEVRYDLATYKDFTRINTDTLPRVLFCGVIYVLCMIFLLFMPKYSFIAKMNLVLSLFTLGAFTFQWFRNRDGGIHYKRMLRNHNGEIPQYLITIDENGFTIKNAATGNEISNNLGDLRYMLESKRLLVLVDDLKTAHIIDKSTLIGGSRDALVAFLHRYCPKLKKRVRKGGFGLILKALMLLLSIVTLLSSLAVLLHIPEKLRGQFTNNTPANQMVEELAELDIYISDQTLDTFLLWESDDTHLFPRYYGTSKAYDLLSFEGMGQYDYDTREWTPSESGVYWFDLEVMGVDTIYSDFLWGLDAMDEDLSFTNIQEDYSQVDIESGMGIVTFSFDYLGQRYTLNAQYEYDWFDTNMLTHTGRILQQDSDPKNLWYTFDGQGVLLYYGTPEQAEVLAKKTGTIWLDPVKNPVYGG